MYLCYYIIYGYWLCYMLHVFLEIGLGRAHTYFTRNVKAKTFMREFFRDAVRNCTNFFANLSKKGLKMAVRPLLANLAMAITRSSYILFGCRPH